MLVTKYANKFGINVRDIIKWCISYFLGVSSFSLPSSLPSHCLTFFLRWISLVCLLYNSHKNQCLFSKYFSPAGLPCCCHCTIKLASLLPLYCQPSDSSCKYWTCGSGPLQNDFLRPIPQISFKACKYSPLECSKAYNYCLKAENSLIIFVEDTTKWSNYREDFLFFIFRVRLSGF